MRLSRALSLPVLESVAAAAVLLGSAACRTPDAPDAFVTIVTVPTPADYVSGGETLLRIEALPGTDLAAISLSLDGSRADAVIAPAPPDRLRRDQHAALALLKGLGLGENEVVVMIDGEPVASLTVTNYAIEGPIFSGEHLDPYFCLSDLAPSRGAPRRFAIGNGESLDGGMHGENCSMERRIDYVYRPTGEDVDFQPLADPASVPSDVAHTMTSEGKTVPFVVRLETGTINRAIYQTAVLADQASSSPDPWNPPSSWNGRLVYTFGGGCEAGFFQGTSTGRVLRADMLGAGYAVASSTLNVNAQGGCNDPLSAETAMMVKERFAEVYGPPLHTIGSGGSGGAMQQLLIAGAYPGIINGIMPTLTFPDAVTYFIDTPDCRLLLRRYLNDRPLDEETKRVIGAWATWRTCENSLGPRPNRIGPDNCPAVIPAEARYDRIENPSGVRCSIYDGMRSVFGMQKYEEITPTPTVEFARSPHDNIGVQYGLAALNAALIDKALFVDLNERIGGWDIDFQWTPERAEADPEAVRIAYETGRVTSGAGGLRVTPIIDERSYLDQTGNFHTSYYSFVMRERLRRDNGHADNYVLQRRGARPSLALSNLALMDEWLSNLALDESTDPIPKKMVNAKPHLLVESCWDEFGGQVLEPQIFGRDNLYENTTGLCNSLYPPHAGPRMVAGGPLTNDVLKCQLKPLDPADYEVEFGEAEWDRLRSTFASGVCDWSKPGVGQTVAPRTWLSFGPSPVNRFASGS